MGLAVDGDSEDLELGRDKTWSLVEKGRGAWSRKDVELGLERTIGTRVTLYDR